MSHLIYDLTRVCVASPLYSLLFRLYTSHLVIVCLT